MPKRIVQLALAVLSGSLLTGWWPFAKLDWPTTFARIRSEFPDVPQMSTARLAALLAGDGHRPVLIDTRTIDEFSVSHLRGAVHADSVEAIVTVMAQVGAERPVVLYCSVGYRSSKLAAALRKQGIGAVANLEGSIFTWANEGRVIVRGTSPVREVHPYNRRWGVLLDTALWPRAAWTAQ